MMFVFPLSGTNNAEEGRKVITYYAFLFIMDGGATDSSKLAELEKVLQEKICQIEKLNISDYYFIL
jgi:hypothetical protein